MTLLAVLVLLCAILGFIDLISHAAGFITAAFRDGWTFYRQCRAAYKRDTRQYDWDIHCGAAQRVAR